MYLHNKYSKWYNSIIERARSRSIEGYTESHHIIPKCIGGTNKKENLVRLTYREHRLCHLLLPYMVTSEYKGLMWRAAKGVLMYNGPNHERVESRSRLAEKARIEATSSRKGIPRSPETIAKIKATKAARPMSDENRELSRQKRIRANQSRKGMPHSAEHNRKVSESRNGQQSPNKGKSMSFEQRQKISEAHKGKIRSVEHCQNISKAKTTELKNRST